MPRVEHDHMRFDADAAAVGAVFDDRRRGGWRAGPAGQARGGRYRGQPGQSGVGFLAAPFQL